MTPLPSAGPVRIVDYDPAWPRMFEEERKRILGAIGDWLVDIQHVGSTSVPGLAAKPVVDIMLGLRSLDDGRHIIGRLKELEYEYNPDDDIPERHYFRRGEPRLFHLHCVETTSDFWRRHIAFRNYLREHPEAADEYADLKRRLAADYGNDRIGYTNAKTEFITRIERIALGEEVA